MSQNFHTYTTPRVTLGVWPWEYPRVYTRVTLGHTLGVTLGYTEQPAPDPLPLKIRLHLSHKLILGVVRKLRDILEKGGDG